MKLRYHIAPGARRDLDEIWDYIARDNLEAADRLLDNLYDRFRMISINKFIGSSRTEIGNNIRVFPYKRYLIFYAPHDETVEILRVLHSARDVDKIFESDLIN